MLLPDEGVEDRRVPAESHGADTEFVAFPEQPLFELGQFGDGVGVLERSQQLALRVFEGRHAVAADAHPENARCAALALGLDDGIESFGGAGDYRHILSFETGDDHFDWTEGFQGRAQYLIALQTSVLTPRPGTGTVSSDPRGFEGDGCESDKAGCTFANTPYSMPVWANFTVVGPGEGVFSTADGNGAVVRRGGAANFVNGILARWPGVGFSIRDAETKALMDADSLYIRNVYLVENGNGNNFESPAKNYGYVVADSATAWNVTEATMADVFTGALPTGATDVTEGNLNLALKSGAAAETAGLSSFAGTPLGARVMNFFGGAMPATAYIGAIDPSAGTKWYEGWTQFKRN